MSREHRASRALAHLGEVDPALAVLALWCRHRDGAGATKTQGASISYGPTFASLGLAEQVGLVAHHVLHVALQHSDRKAALAERLGTRFDGGLFDLAADAIINETLQLAGHALPRPAVLVTDLLSEIGEPSPSAVAALSDWDADRLAMLLHADPQRAEKARDFGAARGFVQDLELGEPDNEGTPQTAADWRGQMLRALEAGRKAGTGIGRLGAILADLAPPTVPWEVELRGLLAKALSDAPRVSHRRPAGRWVAMAADAQARARPEPVFEPGRARDGTRSRVVVALDTSSSIDPLVQSLFFNEIQGVKRRSGAEVHLLAFDEEVFETRRIDGLRPPLAGLELRNGGGTDFAPVFATARGLDPSVLVLLTDLDAPPPDAPRFPVIWAVPGRVPVEAPFGRVLRLGD
ncbi:vWA domain-containing protein [Gymnodinialimonas ulvae]|uniref:vWA domain-containing protein n=1 Tax=Gymnodinialimonas ulvae TaxID=3126504 RepID=UPI0030AC5EF1